LGEIYKDKVCVVTGAASGIGRAMAIQLGASGAALALSDVNEEGLAETVKLIGTSHTNRMMIDYLNVADADAIAAYAPKVEAALGPADYVFNVAGLSRIGHFENTPMDSFEKVMDVNLYGVVRMSKAFLPQLLKTKGGLTNISSIFGLMGVKGQTHYCASKFAVRGFTESLANELKDKGVSVSSVHPGGVATNVARNAQVDALPDNGKTRDEMLANFDQAAITSPERAAEIILNGTAKGKRRIMVGRDSRIVSAVVRLFPKSYPKVLNIVTGKKLEL